MSLDLCFASASFSVSFRCHFSAQELICARNVGGSRHHIWLLIATAVGGFAAAVLVAVFAVKGDHAVSRMARASMGFLVAIVWIMAIADEVVNVLQVRDLHGRELICI